VQYCVLNVQAPYGDNSDNVNDSFYVESERVFDQFPKFNIKISFRISKRK
jgi:hypothetical protein